MNPRNRIIRDILAERDNDIGEKRVRVEVDDDMGTITAHPLQMYQVFANLIGNAIIHNDSPEGASPACGAPFSFMRSRDPGSRGAHPFVRLF